MAKTILIVDDELDICEILSFNLETEGYDVLTAESADEAQQIVNHKSIDLILLDVMMTPKSGFEWARELKADTPTANIPIIFCTAKTRWHRLGTSHCEEHCCSLWRLRFCSKHFGRWTYHRSLPPNIVLSIVTRYTKVML